MEQSKFIIFANQKGGVGKTTLCAMFSNYLVQRGYNIIVLDCDRQASIEKRRKTDLKKEITPRYNILGVDLNSTDETMKIIQKLVSQKTLVIIDCPGNLVQDGIMPLIVNSDFIITPFQFELTSLNSTANFIGIIKEFKKLDTTFNPKFIFVPNMLKPTWGRKEEREEWQGLLKFFKMYGEVAPPIHERACMQRFDTISLTGEQEKIVKETFDFILNIIFPPQKE